MKLAKTIASDELLMEQLINRNWNDFWLKLMARCSYILRNRYKVSWSNEKIKEFSRNVIIEIIELIFIEKKRKWNTDAYTDFEAFILSALDSHVNNTFNKKDPEIGDIDQIEIYYNDHNQSNQSDVIIAVELRKVIFEELKNAGANDDELMVFECLADGIDKPRNIRDELGITESHFHNIWRSLKRKRVIIQKKLETDGY